MIDILLKTGEYQEDSRKLRIRESSERIFVQCKDGQVVGKLVRNIN